MAAIGDPDTLRCAELLELVGHLLGDPGNSLSRAESFQWMVDQSEEVLSGVVEGLRLAVRLGDVEANTAATHLAVLDDALQPLLMGLLSGPDELALLYLRVAKVLRALTVSALPSESIVKAKGQEEGDGSP